MMLKERNLIFVLTISYREKSIVHWISGGNYFELFTHHLVNHAKKFQPHYQIITTSQWYQIHKLQTSQPGGGTIKGEQRQQGYHRNGHLSSSS